MAEGSLADLPRENSAAWRQRLAGRWRWVVLAALLGAATGAAAGWWGVGQRTYRAQAIVRLGVERAGLVMMDDHVTGVSDVPARPFSDAISGGGGITSDGGGITSGGGGGGGGIGVRLDGVVERELAMLTAMAGQAAVTNNADENPDGLVIEARRAEGSASRLIVTATANNPAAAMSAVQSVVAQYQATTVLHQEAEQAATWRAGQEKLGALRAQVAAARARRAGAQVSLAAAGPGGLAASFDGGAEALESAWAQANWRLTESARALEVVERRVEMLEALPAARPSEVAASDTEVAAWNARLREIEAAVTDMIWPPSSAVAALLIEGAMLANQRESRVNDTRLVAVGDDGRVVRAVRLSEARAGRDLLVEEVTRARAGVATLKPSLSAWRTLTAEAESARALLAAQDAAMAELDPGPGVRLIAAEIVAANSGAVPVLGDANEPVEADGGGGGAGAGAGAGVWRDGRPMAAGWGAGAGALLGGVLCGLLFMLDNHVRRGRDGGLVGSAVPVLGAVPTITPGTTPGTQEGVKHSGALGGRASGGGQMDSIQSVRAVLESRMRAAGESSRGSADRSGEASDTQAQVSGGGGGGAFAVVGVESGSGATSVAVGVAASMALSGSRVLLIDLAWLQKPAGDGDDAQALRAGLGVDGVIQELGYLEDEDREAITLGDEGDGDGDAIGFGAILSGVSLRRSVVQTRVPGLAVLSAMGRGESLRGQWAGRVSSRWLEKLLEVSRAGGYDATILDAGSATGSVEGMLGCGAADGTVVVVSRSQTQAQYDKAVTRLRLVGATILGNVLNRSDGKRRGKAGRSAGGYAAGGTGRVGAAGGVGLSSGSGIFAAAIEARAGGSVSGAARGIGPAGSGSQLGGATSGGSSGGGSGGVAPMPRVESEPIWTTDDAQASEGLIGTGVDPVSEPPTVAGPTPARTPPSAGAGGAGGGASGSGAVPVAEVESEQADASAVGADVESSEPVERSLEPQIADDVMDQFVDSAIRAAADRPRRRSPAGSAPPAASATAATSPNPSPGGADGASSSG